MSGVRIVNRTGRDGDGATVALRYLVAVLGLGLTFGAYFVLRYLGLWAEHDTAVFVRIVTEMVERRSLTSPGAYTHGYAYPVWVTTLTYASGLPVRELLQHVTPFLGTTFLALFGFATFRRLLGSDRLGALAAAVLFLAPELVFTVARGNHEKLTVSLTLLLVLALFNSYRVQEEGGRWSAFAAWVTVMYACAFALVALNIFFGSNIILATTTVLGAMLVVMALRPRGGVRLVPIVRRLAVVVSIFWLFFMLMLGHVYPNSSVHRTLMGTAYERVAILLFPPDAEDEAEAATFEMSDPYHVTATDWASGEIYRLLSLFRWVLFGGSFLAWIVLMTRAWIRLRETSLARLFLLAFYGAFGLQLAISVPIDFLNLSAGSNLQVRMYTYFALMAPPLLVLGIDGLVGRVRRPSARTLALGGLTATFTAFAVLSLLKSTLDPVVSNRWLFYRPAEVQAMQFWNHQAWNVEYRQPDSLWVDPEGRAVYAYRTHHPDAPTRANNFVFGPIERPSHALRSDALDRSVVAWRRAPPAAWAEDQVYDNGGAQIMQRTPGTPFQR